MTRVCILTLAQPSTNPRLVKEADALSETGYDVDVLCSHHIDWACEKDRELLASRKWKCTYVDQGAALSGQWPRMRHKAARVLEAYLPLNGVAEAAAGRNVPELFRAASARRADLYIARHPGALAAAGRAARRHNAKLGYDAEDFESGHSPLASENAAKSQAAVQHDRIAAALERQWLRYCDYVTAGSPAIADAYSEQYGIPHPTPILNVFPLRDRPARLRSLQPGPVRLYWFSQTIGRDRGLQDAVRAIGMLPQCKIELHLRGQWASGFEDELRSLANSAGVSQQKIIYHAPAAPDEMVRTAAEFDVGLALEQPVSRNRLLCLTNKLFTYMLAGNAIVATTTPGQMPVLRSIGPAALAYAPGDVASFAAGLKRWYDDRDALERTRRSSWQWGSDRYNWDLEKKWFLKMVDHALAAKRCNSDERGAAARA